MDIFSLQFLSALGAIIVIDLLLAGDNAIVIALAARNVPAHLQRRAIVWGTAGAIIVRSLMTLAVVWLLQIPGLLFAGGAALVWIAYKLLIPEEGGEDAHGKEGSTSFWGAMRTIVIADAVMGLDNVLAVAGAAHGSYVLVVLGLLISIPIVVWGSTWLLNWVERYPAIVYVGSAVLLWTSVKMMLGDPLVKYTIEDMSWSPEPLLYAAVMGGVLWAGFARNHRNIDSRISAKLAGTPPVEGAFRSVLVPIGEARNVLHVMRQVASLRATHPGLKVHLLHVEKPLTGDVSQFVGAGARAEYHREHAEAALAPARAFLARNDIPCEEHIRLGPRAETIVAVAEELGCDHIVMATARKNSLTRMLQDSTTNKVLERTRIPVQLVAGERLSRLEKYGMPAGLTAALTLLAAAAVD